jgi:hypothetical protein
VPEVSRFHGIVITMYYDDHAPPHHHARHGSHRAQIEIATGRLMSGSLPPVARSRVLEWAGLHHAELVENWRRTQEQRPPRRIEPLA